jgi:uncharacterized protein YjdB
MKKPTSILALLCSFVMLLGLASCGGGGDTSSLASKTSSTAAGSQTSSQATSSEYQAPQAPVVEAPYRNSDFNKKVKNLKILTVGDSLTEGDGSLSGWRYALFEKLYASGVTFNFVGPRSSDRDYRLPVGYRNHSGLCGRRIEALDTEFDSIITGEFDVVVMMIGYNNKTYIDTMFDTYDSIINRIYQKNPNAVLFLSAAAPDKWGDNAFKNYNAHIEQLCKQLSDGGKKAYFMPMNTGTAFTDDCYCYDGVHFSEKGNKLVAEKMSAVMTDVLLSMNTADSSYTLPVSPTSITLDKGEVALTTDINLNQSVTLKATVAPTNAAVKNVTWMTGNSNVATVDANGRVTAVGKGTCTITAKTLDGGLAATCKVTVTKKDEMVARSAFSENFKAADKWEGSVSFMDGSYYTYWENYSRKYIINTVKEYDATDNFALNANMKVAKGDSKLIDNYVGFAFDKFELRVIGCATSVALYYDGKEVGKYDGLPCSFEYNTYTLRYNKGEVSVLVSGEEVIKAKGQIGSTSSKLTITNNEISRSVHIKTVDIATYK